jgi:hypothetical protein
MMPEVKKNNNQILLKYASLTTQLFLALGIAVYCGLQIDKLLSFKTPFMVWLIPLIVIAALMYKIIKDTTKKK